MKKIRFRSPVGIGLIFLFCLNISFILAGLIYNILWLVVVSILLSVSQFILHDLFRRKSSILRYYPFQAKLKHLLGMMAIKGLFSDSLSRRMVNDKQYELIMNRAKNLPTDLVRTALSNLSGPGFECLRHMYPTGPADFNVADLRALMGTAQCSQPYSLSVLNVGAINQNLLKNTSVLALSEGANIRGCAVNTGKLGISTNLIRGGGDLIWQIAHEDYAFRNDNGSFNEKLFEVTANRPYIKMIEVILPPNDASILKRLTGNSMMVFLNRLRSLSNGKPIGVRMSGPGREVIDRICQSMCSAKVNLDFITIDSNFSVGGFDSSQVSNTAESLYLDSMACLKKTLGQYSLPTKIIASGMLITEYDLLRAVALGADAGYTTVPMILALDSSSKFGTKDPASQRMRVANFHRNTIEATIRLMELCGYKSLDDVIASDFYRKINFFEIRSLKEIYFDEQPIKGPQLSPD